MIATGPGTDATRQATTSSGRTDNRRPEVHHAHLVTVEPGSQA